MAKYLNVYSPYAEIKAQEEQETGLTAYSVKTEKDLYSSCYL